MTVNLTRISDLENRNGDDQFADGVANRAGTSEEISEQARTVISFTRIVGRSAANLKSPNSPKSPDFLPTSRHSVRMSWHSPFIFCALRNGTRCAFR